MGVDQRMAEINGFGLDDLPSQGRASSSSTWARFRRAGQFTGWAATRSGSSIGAGDEMALHFGLGTSMVESMTIRWLDGTIQQLGPQPVNTTLELRHPRYDEIMANGFESTSGASAQRIGTLNLKHATENQRW